MNKDKKRKFQPSVSEYWEEFDDYLAAVAKRRMLIRWGAPGERLSISRVYDDTFRLDLRPVCDTCAKGDLLSYLNPFAGAARRQPKKAPRGHVRVIDLPEVSPLLPFPSKPDNGH